MRFRAVLYVSNEINQIFIKSTQEIKLTSLENENEKIPFPDE